MIVLSIIGIIALMIGIYLGVIAFDRYSYRCYRYEFFTKKNLLIIGIADALLLGGYHWYQASLAGKADQLNGQILLFLGLIGIVWMVFRNIKHTSIDFGVLGSLFQIAVFSIISVCWMIGIVVIILALLDTKPMYCINGRD